MVMTEEMENAVDHQENNFFPCFPAGGMRLAFGRLRRDDHIAQKMRRKVRGIDGCHGESDDIGRPVAFQILPIQAGDFFIVHDDDADFACFTPQGA